MNTEDYVSFEVAKLLKEKGFNEQCFTYYDGIDKESINRFDRGLHFNNNSYPWGVPYDVKEAKKYVVAPTHQMVSKWIRKTYNIYIDVILLDKEDGDYGYVIQDIITRKYINTSNNNSYKFPEKAFEEALKYLFENVI